MPFVSASVGIKRRIDLTDCITTYSSRQASFTSRDTKRELSVPAARSTFQRYEAPFSGSKMTTRNTQSSVQLDGRFDTAQVNDCRERDLAPYASFFILLECGTVPIISISTPFLQCMLRLYFSPNDAYWTRFFSDRQTIGSFKDMGHEHRSFKQCKHRSVRW